jgi:transmembrane sensor
MENETRIAWLMSKSIKNELTDNEGSELETWLASAPNREFFDEFVNRDALREGMGVLAGINKPVMQQKLNRLLFAGRRQAPKITLARRYMAVAGVSALLGIGTWWWNAQLKHTALNGERQPLVTTNHDISPGGDKAILTLDGGEKIVLASAKDGKLARQGGMSIFIPDSGHLAYKPATGENADSTPGNSKIAFNTLTTPRGGQYRVTLSDGTRVWLNAASSLHYPTAFTGKERVVEITGEAYFEVSSNARMPFMVRANGTEVRVLGTQFDIMSYENEAGQDITLIGGGVRINSGNSSRVLIPGQQARVSSSKDLKVVEDTDVDEVLAWKNNLFSFNDASIETVMRQLARWYDVDIKYSAVVSQHFNGNIPRTVSLSSVLVMLELTGKVHFRIEGREILVDPK